MTLDPGVRIGGKPGFGRVEVELELTVAADSAYQSDFDLRPSVRSRTAKLLGTRKMERTGIDSPTGPH